MLKGQKTKEKHRNSFDLTEKIFVFRSTFESSVRDYEEMEKRLKTTLNSEQEKISRLEFDLHESNLLKSQFENEKNEFERKVREQEETIVQLAMKLETSMTRADEFREKDKAKSRFWMKDEDAKECCNCKKDFNTLRRKHHCRK